MKKTKNRTKASIKTKIQTKIAVIAGAIGIALAAGAGSITLSDEAPVSINLDHSTPETGFLLAGTKNNHVASFRVEGDTKADYLVRKLTIETVKDLSVDGLSASRFTNNVTKATLEYKNSQNASVTVEAPISTDGKAVFTNLDLFVPKYDDSVFVVRLDIAESEYYNGGTARSNDRVQIALGETSGDFVVKNVQTGVEKTKFARREYIKTGPFFVRLTEPTFSVSASSPSGSAVVGVNEALRFNVTASAGGDVEIDQLIFKVNTTDNARSGWNRCDNSKLAPSDFSLYRSVNLITSMETSDSEWELLDYNLSKCDATEALGYIKLQLASPMVVAEGATQTYLLYMDTNGASTAQDDALRIDLAHEYMTSGPELLDNAVPAQNIPAASNYFTVNSAVADRIKVGDVLLLSETMTAKGPLAEYVLVVGVSGTSVNVIRGYNGTTPVRYAARKGQVKLYRMPSAIMWRDSEEFDKKSYWGSYMVDDLPVHGGSLIF